MLNKPLYAALRARFGKVSITNENVRRVESRRGATTVVSCRGENYQVSCPLCNDTKGRLSISYLWLEKPALTGNRRTDLAHCYNEGCAVHEERFWGPIAKDVEAAKLGLLALPRELEGRDSQVVHRQVGKIRLPAGFVPLSELDDSHPANVFIQRKYRGSFTKEYLSKQYGVGFTDTYDDIYPHARGRVIFPIFRGDELSAWQGRTIYPDNKMRWYLPAGFVKTVYNIDRVLPINTVVIAEGIPSAIACGGDAVAIFGKTLTRAQVAEISQKFSSALIATDPETFVPDNRPNAKGVIYAAEMKAKLDRVMRHPSKLLQWPLEILEVARKHNCGDGSVEVPDPADIGILNMRHIIERSLHGSAGSAC